MNIVVANLLTQNFTNHSVEVNQGMQIFKYETELTEDLTDASDFNSQTISQNQFQAATPDLEAIATGSEFLTLNHYGDNPPDITTNDWWDDDSDSSTKYNWRYRKCFEIDHTALGASTQTDYQVLIRIDTATLVSASKMNINGDDIRFIDSDQNELDYYIARDMNTSDTHIWIQVDNIDAATTEDICMYYGDVSGSVSAASDRDATFTYSSPEDIYFALWRNATTANIASYTASNDVSYGVFSNTFAQWGVSTGVTVPSQATPISSEGPLSISFPQNGTDSAAPISYAGTSFVQYARRGTDGFDIIAPFGTANVTIQEASGGTFIDACGAGSNFSVTSGTAVSVTCDIINNNAFTVTSDVPVIVGHLDNNNRDTKVLYPSERALQPDSGQYELWGVGSGSFQVASNQECLGVEISRSNNTTITVDLNAGNDFAFRQSGAGNEGTGNSFHVVADCPIGASSNADSDGGEETEFLPEQEWSDTYLLPQDTQYVASSAISTALTCEVLDALDIVQDTDTSTGGNGTTQPSKIYFPSSNVTTDVVNFTAGERMVCPEPVFAYHERQNDETNLLSYIQARKFTDVEPIVEDPDTVNEEGLYFESGFDSATTALDPEAELEWIIDISSLTNSEQVFWNEIDFNELISDRTDENSVDAVSVEVAYADPVPNCTAATYTTVSSTETNITNTPDTSPPFSTNQQNLNRVQIPDEVSDSECLRLRLNLRTGDEAYSPRLEDITVKYVLPTLLEDQISTPTISISGSSTDDRVRILKITNPNATLLNSTCQLRYNSVTTPGVFTNADFEFFENQNNILNPQFDFPPFPATPPTILSGSSSVCDPNNDLSIYFDHARSAGVIEQINMTVEQDIGNLNGPLSERAFVLEVLSP